MEPGKDSSTESQREAGTQGEAGAQGEAGTQGEAGAQGAGARLRSVGLYAPQFSQRPLGVAHWRKKSPTAALVASTVSDVSGPRRARSPGPRAAAAPPRGAPAPRRARPPAAAWPPLAAASSSAASLAASWAAAARATQC